MNGRRSALLLVLCGLLLLALPACGERARAGVSDAEAARAAVAQGAWEEALLAAERAEAQDAARFTPFRYFVRGCAAYAESFVWEEAARAGDTEAAKMAYQQAEDALAYWQMAATRPQPWPAARRNVERGLLRLQALREQKKETVDPPPDERTPDPAVDPTPEDEEAAEPSTALIETGSLPPQGVARLLEVMVERETRKRALRRAQRATRSSEVERDW
jgi:hypothetical protein